jgi:hypothetical protein
MQTAEISKGFWFRVLTPEQQRTATEIRAQEIHDDRVEKAAREDWRRASAAVQTPENPRPTDAQIRPLAQTYFQERMAKKTDAAREAEKRSDWLRAESDLRTESRYSDSRFKMPASPGANTSSIN